MKQYCLLIICGLSSCSILAAKRAYHVVNNTPFTVTASALIGGSDRVITSSPILPKGETTLNIEEYRIEATTIRITDEKKVELATKTFPTAYDYPSDLEVTASVVDPEKLLASPETVQTKFSLIITQKSGSGKERHTDKIIPLGSSFVLEHPVRLLVVNNTPYRATVTTLTDIRGIIKKTSIIKAYNEVLMQYAISQYPVEGFTINLYAQNGQTPCLVASVSKLSAQGKPGPTGIRPSMLIISKEADGSITVHEAITSPLMPQSRANVVKEWISKDYQIFSKAYKRTAAVCDVP